MTKAVLIEKIGGPEVLKIQTIDLNKLGPEEVLIEQKAIGLNFIDTYHRSGLYPIELPSGLGTALSDDSTNPPNKMYYVDAVLGIGQTVTIDPPTSSQVAFTNFPKLHFN